MSLRDAQLGGPVPGAQFLAEIRGTNDPDSELAHAAETVLPLGAGSEKAVAATKTYLNQVAGLALLAAHAAGQGAGYEDALRLSKITLAQ